MGVVTDFAISLCKEGYTGVNSAPHCGEANSTSPGKCSRAVDSPGGPREITHESMVLD
jgi:hypothetical protein